MTHEEITALLQLEMSLATGCTGPTAYALASACCREYLTAEPTEIRVRVSPAYLKMGFGVATPGTGRTGIEIATAVGLYGGDPKAGMQVLKDIPEEAIEKAKALADKDIIFVESEPGTRGVYVRTEVVTPNETVTAVVEKTHDGISLVQVDDKVRFSAVLEDVKEDRIEDHPERLTLEEIFAYPETATLEEIGFLLDGYRTNLELAEDGVRGGFGLQSGRKLLFLANPGAETANLVAHPLDYLPADEEERAKILVSAASDGRMGGSHFPAMAAMGDGNQGLTVLLPIGAVAEQMGVSDLETARAMALGCLMLFYIKKYIGRAAAMCLCAICAAAGAAAGVGYLKGLTEHRIRDAVKDVLAELGGMICDGAKNACALKMATAVTGAMQAGRLAQLDIEPGYYDGISDETLEDTVLAITTLANESMDMMDQYIVDAILMKTKRK